MDSEKAFINDMWSIFNYNFGYLRNSLVINL